MTGVTAVTMTVPNLKMADRCDGSDCNAQAHVRTTQRFQTLDFCGHDFAKHEAGLTKAGFAVAEDTRHTLTNK